MHPAERQPNELQVGLWPCINHIYGAHVQLDRKPVQTRRKPTQTEGSGSHGALFSWARSGVVYPWRPSPLGGCVLPSPPIRRQERVQASLTQSHAHRQTDRHTSTHTLKHTQEQTHTHTHTHTHTLTHSHTEKR